MKSWFELMEERGTRKDMPMKPQVVTHTLNKLLNDDAIVSSDSGTIATWTARHVDIRGTMQFSLSGSLATMANGLPYSIGAAVAYPGRQVVCVVGDGGLTMLMGEIATLVKYKLQVCVIVIKNNVLGQIKWEQMILEGNPGFGVELEPIDFAMVATACGAKGYTIERPEDAENILREALAHSGPTVVQAVVDPNEPPMPGKITTEQAMHFAEALARGQKDALKIIKTIGKDKIPRGHLTDGGDSSTYDRQLLSRTWRSLRITFGKGAFSGASPCSPRAPVSSAGSRSLTSIIAGATAGA